MKAKTKHRRNNGNAGKYYIQYVTAVPRAVHKSVLQPVMMEFSSGMIDPRYHGGQDMLPHIYHPQALMGGMPGQMTHFTQQVDYGMQSGPPHHSMTTHSQYGGPMHTQMFPDYSASTAGFLMALPAPAMSMSGFVPPHVPLDTNYRTNPGFVPPAHSGMVPMPITLSPPNNQSHPSNGMGSPQGIGSPSVVGPTLTQPPPLQRQPPAPPSTAASSTETRTSRSKSQRIAKQNGSAPPNRPASRASSQTPSTDSTAAPLKMAKGPFSNIKLELEDIPSEAYFFNEEDKKFWCTKCNYSTPRLDKVIQHIKAHLYSKWRCDECGKAFIKSCDMERHAHAHAMGRTRPKSKGSEKSSIQQKPLVRHHSPEQCQSLHGANPTCMSSGPASTNPASGCGQSSEMPTPRLRSESLTSPREALRARNYHNNFSTPPTCQTGTLTASANSAFTAPFEQPPNHHHPHHQHGMGMLGCGQPFSSHDGSFNSPAPRWNEHDGFISQERSTGGLLSMVINDAPQYDYGMPSSFHSQGTLNSMTNLNVPSNRSVENATAMLPGHPQATPHRASVCGHNHSNAAFANNSAGQIMANSGSAPQNGEVRADSNRELQPSFSYPNQFDVNKAVVASTTDCRGTASNSGASSKDNTECIIVENEDGTQTKIMVQANGSVEEPNNNGSHSNASVHSAGEASGEGLPPAQGAGNSHGDSEGAESNRLEVRTAEGKIVCLISAVNDSNRPDSSGPTVNPGGAANSEASNMVNGEVQIVRVDRGPHVEDRVPDSFPPDNILDGSEARVESGTFSLSEVTPGNLQMLTVVEQHIQQESQDNRPGLHAVIQELQPGRPRLHAVCAEPQLARPGLHVVSQEFQAGRPGLHALNQEPQLGRPGLHALNQEPQLGRPGLHALNQEPQLGRPGLHALRGLLNRNQQLEGADVSQATALQGDIHNAVSPWCPNPHAGLEVNVAPHAGQQVLDISPDRNTGAETPSGQEEVPKLQPVLNPNATSSRQLCCNLCSYATREMWHLEKHFLAHTRNYKICKYCGKAFERPSDLVRHEERHRQRTGPNGVVPSQVSPPTPIQLSPKGSPPLPKVRKSPVLHKRTRIYQCDMCHKRFVSSHSLRFHKSLIHHSALVRLDAYRTNVLLHTKLLQCEVGTNNQVTLHLTTPSLNEVTKPEAQVPNVSTLSDVFYIMKQAQNPTPGQDRSALIAKATDIMQQNKTTQAVQESGEIVNDPDTSLITAKSSDTMSPPVPRSSQEQVNSHQELHPFVHGISRRHPIPRRSMDGNYRCTKCNYSTNVKTKIEGHQKAHLGRYICKLCGKAFVKTSDLTRHWVCHETIPGSKYLSCDSCPYKTLDKQVLENHMKEHYRIVSPRKPRLGVLKRRPPVPSPSKQRMKTQDSPAPTQVETKVVSTSSKDPIDHQTGLAYYCHDCGLGFQSVAHLKRHRVAVHSVPGDIVRMPSQDTQMKMCRYCGKQFMRQHNLQRHEQLHVNGLHIPKPPAVPGQIRGRKYECKYCGKDFGRLGQLVRHENFHALGRTFASPSQEVNSEAPHVCKYCGKEFSRPGNLANHMQFHLGLKGTPSSEPAECQYCGKQFSTGAYLKQHIRLHTGETPFGCDSCGKKFAMKQNLIIHKRRDNCGSLDSIVKKRRRKRRRFFSAIW